MSVAVDQLMGAAGAAAAAGPAYMSGSLVGVMHLLVLMWRCYLLGLLALAGKLGVVASSCYLSAVVSGCQG